jgi:hypothetical protein
LAVSEFRLELLKGLLLFLHDAQALIEVVVVSRTLVLEIQNLDLRFTFLLGPRGLDPEFGPKGSEILGV